MQPKENKEREIASRDIRNRQQMQSNFQQVASSMEPANKKYTIYVNRNNGSQNSPPQTSGAFHAANNKRSQFLQQVTNGSGNKDLFNQQPKRVAQIDRNNIYFE